MSNPTPYGVPDGQGTPWPQYDQGGASAPTPGAPQGTPGAAYGGGYGGLVTAATGKLPSRAPGTIMIVLGVVMMLIVAPVVFFVAMYTGSQRLADIAVESQAIRNGDSVEVTDSGRYTVVVGNGNADSCTMTDANGQAHSMKPFQGARNVYSLDGLTPGTYKVQCDGMDQKSNLTGMNIGAGDLMSLLGSALIWSTVVGVGGIIVMIIGIVLVVRANRRRRAIRQQAMMSAIG